MLSVTNIKEENMNESYDPEMSNNGGGYYQPTIEVDFSDGVQIVICDTSCGEFGTRIGVSMYDANHTYIAGAMYGTMIDIYQWQSDFHRNLHGAYLDLIHEATYYGVLESEELADMIAELEGEEF